MLAWYNAAMTPICIAALLVAALALLLWARLEHRRTGLPQGAVVYSDTGARHTVARPLYDPELDLVGKPDYIVVNDDGYIPVEVKSGHTPAQPYEGHIFQLAAYGLLVRRVLGKPAPYGYIRYPERTFRIAFTPELERRLLAVLALMRQAATLREVPRTHEQRARCRACGYRQICDQRLE